MEEQWLDSTKANTIDEQQVLDTLESASDYKRGLKQLDDNGKATVRKLRHRDMKGTVITDSFQKL